MTDASAEGTSGVILKISLKGGGEVEVDTGKITNMDTYQEIFVEGLKSMINRIGMSKIASGITKLDGAEKDKALAAIADQAQKTVQAIYDGNIKSAKGGTKRSGAVQTEAMRLAKALVKDTLRKNGYKIGAFDAKEITAFAKDVLADNASIYTKAEENLASRAAMPVKGLSVASMLGEKANDETLKAKPKVPPKPKAKAKDVVAAATQGKVPTARAKPAQTAH